MEHLQHECREESANPTHSHEAKPRRPDKIPLDGRADNTEADLATLTYSQALRNTKLEAETPTTVPPGMGAADGAAIRGSGRIPQDPNSRLAQFWQQPGWYFHNGWRPSACRATYTQGAHGWAAAQSPTQSRDDIDMIRPPSRPGRDDAQSILQEMEHLRVQLSAANSRADQAERAAEELERHLSSKPTPNEATTSSDESADAIKSLQVENQGLRAELDDARSHIFSLQPYRKELTPEEVGRVGVLHSRQSVDIANARG